MQYWHFMVTGTLILALVMTSGCSSMLTGDLRAEISDSPAMTIPLPISSVLSVMASRNSTAQSGIDSLTGEKFTILKTPLHDTSQFHVKSGTEGLMMIETGGLVSEAVPSPQVPDHGTPSTATPDAVFKPRTGTSSCTPVAGAKVAVTLLGTLNKTHIADCITQENGDFSFDVPASAEKSTSGLYMFNFEITAPGYDLPGGSSEVITDMANVSDGQPYTFNLCYQQPSEPDASAITRGGIAVIGRIVP